VLLYEKLIEEGAITRAAADAVGLTALPIPSVSPDGVTIEGAALVGLGGRDILAARVSPVNASNKAVTWSSSNPRVATVSRAGVVSGISAGSATITATTANGITASSVINVDSLMYTDALRHVISSSSATIMNGASVKLGELWFSSGAPGSIMDNTQAPGWSSSNPEVATVSDDGLVTGTGAGEATISTSDGRTCAIVVRGYTGMIPPDFTGDPTAPTGVFLSSSGAIFRAGKTIQLAAMVSTVSGRYDAVTHSKNVVWVSSNPAVATVASDGTVRGVATGSAIITVYTENGFADECAVIVW
jgi:alpha-amylase